MNVVTLRTDLYKTLEKDAQQDDRTVSDLVNEAVEDYVRERQRAKLDREIVAYEALYPQFKRGHLGQWVAVHNRQLVDYDDDRTALYRRVRAEYGQIAVLLRQVKEQPHEEIWLRTPSMGIRRTP